MSQVKLSVSLSESEVAALDKYAHAAGLKLTALTELPHFRSSNLPTLGRSVA